MEARFWKILNTEFDLFLYTLLHNKKVLTVFKLEDALFGAGLQEDESGTSLCWREQFEFGGVENGTEVFISKLAPL